MLQARSIGVDHVQLEVAAIALVLVGRKDNLLAVRCEGGGEARATEIGDLFGVLAFAVGHPQLHLHRRGEVVIQQVAVILDLLRRVGMVGAPHDLLGIA